MMNRRSAIAVLGLVPASSGAAVVEALGAASEPLDCKMSNGTMGYGITKKSQVVVNALRALADELEGGRAYVQKSGLVTGISPYEFIEHEFSISFHLIRPPQPEDEV